MLLFAIAAKVKTDSAVTRGVKNDIRVMPCLRRHFFATLIHNNTRRGQGEGGHSWSRFGNLRWSGQKIEGCGGNPSYVEYGESKEIYIGSRLSTICELECNSTPEYIP